MLIEINGCKLRLPDFLLVGAAKSGTTSLYFYLRQHPEVFLPSNKEPRFLSYGETKSRKIIHPFTGTCLKTVITGLDEYIGLFDEAPKSALIGEATTQYLYDYRNVHNNISKLYGDRQSSIKIIMVLRNPCERAWSNYVMHRNSCAEPLDFQEAIKPETVCKRLEDGWPLGYDYIGFGLYYEQVSFWLEHYPDTLILIQEELDKSPEKTIKKVFEFLGVDRKVSVNLNERFNASGDVKNPLMRIVEYLVFKPNFFKKTINYFISNELKYRLRTKIGSMVYKKSRIPEQMEFELRNFYRQDVTKLQSRLGIDLTSWL